MCSVRGWCATFEPASEPRPGRSAVERGNAHAVMTIARAISLVTCALLVGMGTPALGAGTVVDGTVTAERPWPQSGSVKVTKDASVCGAEQPSEALQITADG